MEYASSIKFLTYIDYNLWNALPRIFVHRQYIKNINHMSRYFLCDRGKDISFLCFSIWILIFESSIFALGFIWTMLECASSMLFKSRPISLHVSVLEYCLLHYSYGMILFLLRGSSCVHIHLLSRYFFSCVAVLVFFNERVVKRDSFPRYIVKEFWSSLPTCYPPQTCELTRWQKIRR